MQELPNRKVSAIHKYEFLQELPDRKVSGLYWPVCVLYLHHLRAGKVLQLSGGEHEQQDVQPMSCRKISG